MQYMPALDAVPCRAKVVCEHTFFHHKMRVFICTEKCCLDVKATGKSKTPNGYIKVTDVNTGNVDNWAANKAGRYIATIDMGTCTTTRRTYGNWTQAHVMTSNILNSWKMIPDLANLILVDVAVGAGYNSFAPWIDIWKLNPNSNTPLYASTQSSVGFKACLKGERRRELRGRHAGYSMHSPCKPFHLDQNYLSGTVGLSITLPLPGPREHSTVK